MKSELYFTTLSISAVDMRACENPLTPLVPQQTVNNWPFQVDESIPVEDAKYINYGYDKTSLPYRTQDQYGRERQLRDLKVAVLENNVLRATFLMELGGRLWSLYHKPGGRDLLFTNPVIQPGNLALRDAWFAGGVEWNMGVTAHNPFTCSSPFFATLNGDNNEPVLRMYEFERIHSVPYQVDFYLPEDSPVLLVRCRLFNPHEFEIPAYWWSNIAIRDTKELRVLTPTDWAYFFEKNNSRNSVKRISAPVYLGTDISYPKNNVASHDYFYRLPDNKRPWITAMDKDGRGLVQTSTSLQKGRKLFVWGTGPGGRRWQNFLSEPDNFYVEIQAGLGRTQVECVPMPANTEWSWLEAYGLMEAHPKLVHGNDWKQACGEVERQLEKIVSRNWLEAELKRTEDTANRAPEKVVQKGSGWGSLEEKRRQKLGLAYFNKALVFDQSTIGPDQQQWLSLLEKGDFTESYAQEIPRSYMTQEPWIEMLEIAIDQGNSNHWYAWFMMGVMHYSRRDYEKAKSAWLTSLEREKNAWAYRNLAVLCYGQGDVEKALDMWQKAWQINCEYVELAIEYAEGLANAGEMNQMERFLDSLSSDMLSSPRIQVSKAQCALHNNDLDLVDAILGQIELPNLREGETLLTDLWYTLQEKLISKNEGREIDEEIKAYVRRELKPPEKIDFRMTYEWDGIKI
jgi:tetratricopeptide (TPR) repeat protein